MLFIQVHIPTTSQRARVDQLLNMRLKNKNTATPTSRIVFALLLILAMIFAFILFVMSSNTPKRDVPIENGVINLTTFDFEASLAKLPLEWDYYPCI